MALQKQLVPLQIDQGLDTKVDPKQGEVGFLRKAENIVYETLKQFRKRNGYDLQELKDLNGSSITDAVKLAKYKEELLVLSPTKLYSYSEAALKWVERGQLSTAVPRVSSVYKSANDQDQVSSVISNGLQIFAWREGSTGIRYSVQDITTKSFLVSNGTVSATGERPQVGVVQGQVFIFYGDSTNLKYKTFSIFNPDVLSSATTAASDRHATLGLIDVTQASDRIFVAYNGAVPSMFYINSAGTQSSTIGISGQTATNALEITLDPDARVLLTFASTTTIKATIYSFALTSALLGVTLIESVSNVTNCSTIQQLDHTYKLYYEVAQAGTSNNYVKSATLNLSGTVSTPTVFMRSVGLASEPFYYGTTQMVSVVHESALQATYFVVDSTGFIVTKYADQTASGVLTWGVVPAPSVLDDGRIMLPLLFKSRLVGDSGTFYSTKGVQAVTIDFNPANKYSNALLADSLHICAGLLRIYDGSTLSEHGFHIYPESLSQSATATTGGSMSNGSYGYVAVYRWVDNNGRDHLSTPTPLPLTSTLSGGTSTQIVTVAIPTLRITDKSNVKIDLYRTEAAGTTYYKVTDDLSPLANDKTVDTVSFTDTIADATLISRETLYTTGGVIENISAPACSQVAVYYSNRLCVIGEDSNRIYFSKMVDEGRPVEFTDLIYRDVDPAGGALTAIRSIDDKMIAWSKDACFFLSGEGPNNLGQQDTLNLPEIIGMDIGCIQPDSIVLTPNGLMFKSRKGIYQITHGLALEYIGVRVEAYNDRTITSAQIVGALNQVRFTLDIDTTLVFNYALGKWATFENHGALSSIVILNDYYYLREDGALYKENRSSFADAASPIKMRVETAWLSLTEMQGLQRVYRALIIGTYKSAHKLRVRVAYDFKDAWVDEVIIDPAQFVDTSRYGDVSPYGEGIYGGSGTPYQARIDFGIQKCQSIKLLIEDVQDTIGEGLSISAITVMAGAKQGTGKLPSGQSFGTT